MRISDWSSDVCSSDLEGDEIVAPDLFQVRHLGDWLAVLPDAVERDVGADVDILAQGRQARIAWLAGRQQRTGLRVELAEAEEIVSQRLGQDGEIEIGREHD